MVTSDWEIAGSRAGSSSLDSLTSGYRSGLLLAAQKAQAERSLYQFAVQAWPVWEAWSGLKAPFTLLGHYESTYVACPGAPVQPGETCDICGQGIRYVARFRDAAGVEFVTGLDCATKSDSPRTVSQANSIRNQIRAEQNRKRTAEQTAAAAAEFRAVREIADTLPHPRGFADRETGNPLTLADYVDWFAKNAGASGYLAALKFAVKLCREAVAA